LRCVWDRGVTEAETKSARRQRNIGAMQSNVPRQRVAMEWRPRARPRVLRTSKSCKTGMRPARAFDNARVRSRLVPKHTRMTRTFHVSAPIAPRDVPMHRALNPFQHTRIERCRATKAALRETPRIHLMQGER